MKRARTSDGDGYVAQEKSDVVVVHLGKHMLSVGAAHICDDGCEVHRRRMHVTHSTSVCDGGV